MAIETKFKQPFEIIRFGVNFTNRATDETGTLVGSITAINTIYVSDTADGSYVSSDMVVPASSGFVGMVLYTLIASGVPGSKYKYTARATLSNSEVLEGDLLIKVKEN
jgi:hypothetical protein